MRNEQADFHRRHPVGADENLLARRDGREELQEPYKRSPPGRGPRSTPPARHRRAALLLRFSPPLSPLSFSFLSAPVVFLRHVFLLPTSPSQPPFSVTGVSNPSGLTAITEQVTDLRMVSAVLPRDEPGKSGPPDRAHDDKVHMPGPRVVGDHVARIALEKMAVRLGHLRIMGKKPKQPVLRAIPFAVHHAVDLLLPARGVTAMAQCMLFRQVPRMGHVQLRPVPFRHAGGEVENHPV